MIFTIDPVRRSGGLALFWKNSLQVEFKFSDKNLLDVQVQYGSFCFFVSYVYGDPSGIRKQYMWKRLTRIGVNRKESYMVISMIFCTMERK